MKKHAFALAAALASFGAMAADIATTQGQTSLLQGQSTASIESGAVNINSIGAPDSPYKINEQRGTTTIRTAPQVIAPSIANSSGGYNCTGGVSGGGSVIGFGGSAAKSIEMNDCRGFFRMDKAAGRAGAAIKAAQTLGEKIAAAKAAAAERKAVADTRDLESERAMYAEQAQKFTKLWDAEYCALEGGAAAYAKAGLECPDENKRAETALNDRPRPTLSSDPLIRARQLGQ